MGSTGTCQDRVPQRRRGRRGGRFAAVVATAVLGLAAALPAAPRAAAAAPSAYWPGHDVARRVVANPSGPGGWTLNGWGAVNAFGGAQALSGAPNWGSWDIARDLAVTSSGAGGYVLDGWGGIHRLGDAPPLAGAPYWRGFDIARRLVLDPAGSGGWVLDGWGGVHAFGGAARLSDGSYWRGWDIARDLVVTPSGTGGYVLDGWGGIHALGDAPAVSGTPYWRGWDIARKLVLNPSGSGGWVLDGWGGVHRFGGAPAVSGAPKWTGWDIARDLSIDSTGSRGYLLDGWGGVHAVAPLAAPTNTVVPVVSGTEVEGQALSATDGTWTGAAPIAFAYRWERCDAPDAPGSCADIPGATADAYVLTGDDVGKVLHVVVTATNVVGAQSATSAFTGPIAAAVAPANTVLPVVSGDYVDGQVLSTTDGTWTGTPAITYAYQWQRCDDAGGLACADIAGATSSTYTLTADDVGKYVGVTVVATNGAGTGSAPSGLEGPIASAPDVPWNTWAPSIQGTLTEGEELTSDPGVWGGNPTSYSYQWQRCSDDEGLDCSDIAGATASTYTLTGDDVDTYVRVTVVATNTTGAGEAAPSFPVGLIDMAVAVNLTPPSVTGTATQGEELTAGGDTWQSTGPVTPAYTWQRCDDAAGTVCTDIAGGSTYTLTADDVAKFVRAAVVAWNDGGPSAAATSATTAQVEAAVAPTNVDAPIITGQGWLGGTLDVSEGTWDGTAPIGYSYQWYRCVDPGDTGSCVALDGATATSYVITADDLNKALRVRQTATNAAGSAAVWSSSSGIIFPD